MQVSAVIFGVVVAIGAMVWAETAAPLASKPSVILRASTGDLPTRDLPALVAAEADKAQATHEHTKQLQAQAAHLQQQVLQGAGHLQALETRVQEKAAFYNSPR